MLMPPLLQLLRPPMARGNHPDDVEAKIDELLMRFGRTGRAGALRLRRHQRPRVAAAHGAAAPTGGAAALL